MRVAVWCLLLAVRAAAADPYAVDWGKLEPEIVARFSELLRVDTTNPPGNETRAAQVLEAALHQACVETKLLALEPARANLVARIRGNGRKRPLLLLGHTDTVGVQREKWTVDPFAALRRNGSIYGRGATDDKHHAAAAAIVMQLLRRLDVRLARDVIFLAEAGEEGTTRVGIDFLIESHWNEIAAEYALAEGGSVIERAGKVQHVLIATTEKVPRGLRLVAQGPSGHGSRPFAGNAVVHLAAAVARAGSWNPPARLNPTTREYFTRLARISPPEQAARYLALLDPAQAPAAAAWFAANDPGVSTLLRTSVAPTVVKGGFRSNVIPSEAEAYLDVRALPDEDMTKFVAELKHVIGDASVEVVPTPSRRPVAPPSHIDTEMFRALEKVQRHMFPGAATVPVMLAGATDNAQLRSRGVQAYGFGPIVAAGGSGGAHTDDERLPVRSLVKMTEFLWRAVLAVAAEP